MNHSNLETFLSVIFMEMFCINIGYKVSIEGEPAHDIWFVS
jgi:hypothetical protein